MSTTIDPDTERGLYRKYELFRVSETDPDHRFQVFDPFFVLRFTTDPFAVAAVAAYADACEYAYPQLASDLRRSAGLHFIDGQWRNTKIT